MKWNKLQSVKFSSCRYKVKTTSTHQHVPAHLLYDLKRSYRLLKVFLVLFVCYAHFWPQLCFPVCVLCPLCFVSYTLYFVKTAHYEPSRCSYKGVDRKNHFAMSIYTCTIYFCQVWLSLLTPPPPPPPFLLYLQDLGMMQKMSCFFPLLLVCLDVCAVHAISLAQLSPLFVSHPLLTLWGAGLIRAFLLISLTFAHPGDQWLSSFGGLQSLGVLCLHFPIYTTVLWVLGLSTMEELWGWHSWERVGGFCWLDKTLHKRIYCVSIWQLTE